MTSGPATRAALATALVLVAGLGACGFSDALTSRGFVEEGDQICIDTLVKTGAGFQPGQVAPPEFLGALAGAYREAAARFEGLEVSSEDEEMRDSVVDSYSSFADRLRGASEAAAAGSAVDRESEEVFAGISAQQDEMMRYGFEVCGGGGA